MVDLTKAPEGTTGYYVNGASITFYNGNKYWHDHHGNWVDSLNGYEWRSENVVPIKPEWTIYNNTMALRELTDEQRGLLFNHWCNGGDMQAYNRYSQDEDKWFDIDPHWNIDYTYRAKQKTERELFIDLATEIAADECETERLTESIDAFIVKLFDAGFKAPQTNGDK